MDSNRAAAKLVRCKVEDQHEGSVQNAVWDAGLSIFVTGAVDGRVKIWDAKRVSCIWTLDPNASLLAPNPCQKVVSDLARGLVVAALSTGEIIVWSGLASLLSEDTTRPSVIETRIPPPRHDAGSSASRDIFGLYIDARVSSHVSILAIHSNDPHFYRFRIDISSMHIETTTYGNASFGPISAIKPVFASQERHHSFIIVGDQLGCVSIYQWDAPPSPTAQPIQAFRKFEAHDDGAVTSIAFDSVVLATGSARGTIALFESLTLERLRIIAGPSPRYADRVSKIILQREVLVASIGPNVTAIKAGVVGKDKASGKGKSSRAKQTGAHKWHQQLELNHAIKESRAALEEEQRYRHKVFGREKEQHSTLENLGLDEVEAVEYVLMLSRDDEERRRMNSGPSFPSSSGSGPGEGDDMFEDDFDDAYASTSTHARSSADSRRSSMSQSTDRSLPRVSPSISNLKVQVSPRFRPEPTEAGFSISPLNASAGPSSGVMIPPSSDAFPRVSPTQSPATSVPNGSWVRKPSLPSSPESMRSAWGTARRSAASSETHSPVSGSPLMSRGTWGASGHDQNNMLPEDEELDEDLRFAIQLSLAEARSRGEDV
ncbi:hypothetical protein PLICRDRAFT_159580 [Plicaturopsis crispa FD-325 SS-3]|nr:hypothetical protein PLICRDRAFT_159580 [Plicaturopsis crispa FD-325 SS-3]